jgi:hypothetical protein
MICQQEKPVAAVVTEMGYESFSTTEPLREDDVHFLALAPDHNDLQISPPVHP